MKIFGLSLILAAVAVATCAGDISAQQEAGGLQFADYTFRRSIKQARDMIDRRQYAEAVKILGELLERKDELVFAPSAQNESYRSLKAEAEAILATLPPEGLEWYETQFGPIARVD